VLIYFFFKWKRGKEKGITKSVLCENSIAEWDEKVVLFVTMSHDIVNNTYAAKRLNLKLKKDTTKGKPKKVGKVDINLAKLIVDGNELKQYSFPLLLEDKYKAKLLVKARINIVKVNNKKVISELKEEELDKYSDSEVYKRGGKYYLTKTETNVSDEDVESTMQNQSEFDFNDPFDDQSMSESHQPNSLQKSKSQLFIPNAKKVSDLENLLKDKEKVIGFYVTELEVNEKKIRRNKR